MASGSVGLNDAIELRLGSQQSVAIRANLFLLDMEQGCCRSVDSMAWARVKVVVVLCAEAEWGQTKNSNKSENRRNGILRYGYWPTMRRGEVLADELSEGDIWIGETSANREANCGAAVFNFENLLSHFLSFAHSYVEASRIACYGGRLETFIWFIYSWMPIERILHFGRNAGCELFDDCRFGD